MTGYTPEDCKDPDLRFRMVHPDDRERMRSEDERTFEPGQVVATEYRVLHRDGRTVWVRNEAVMLEDETSGSRYWQGFMLDITGRKQAQEKLREAEERYRALVERTPAITYEEIVSSSGSVSISYISPQVERILGYAPGELDLNDPYWGLCSKRCSRMLPLAWR